MSDQDAFLRAICDQPDEDTPRLAFADFLDDSGGGVNAAWAELIRVQVPLARGPGADRDRLVARECELTPVVVDQWSERMGIPAPLRWKNWVRGFPLTLGGTGEHIRAAYPTFAGRVPFREITIRNATEADLIALAAWPEAALVRKLGVWTELPRSISERGLLALAGCSHLSGLQRLQMEWVGYTERGMRAFLDSPFLAGLVSVKLVGRDFEGMSDGLQQRVRQRFSRWDVS